VKESIKAGVLRDRMCYFVIGNMPRLRAELTERGLLRHPTTTTTTTATSGGAATGAAGEKKKKGSASSPSPSKSLKVTVAAVVRALQVGAACTYPPFEMATHIARAVGRAEERNSNNNSSNKRSGARADDGGDAWNVLVDIDRLEDQLDDYLMEGS
jgi:hypothetical protein